MDWQRWTWTAHNINIQKKNPESNFLKEDGEFVPGFKLKMAKPKYLF